MEIFYKIKYNIRYKRNTFIFYNLFGFTVARRCPGIEAVIFGNRPMGCTFYTLLKFNDEENVTGRKWSLQNSTIC